MVVGLLEYLSVVYIVLKFYYQFAKISLNKPLLTSEWLLCDFLWVYYQYIAMYSIDWADYAETFGWLWYDYGPTFKVKKKSSNRQRSGKSQNE